MSQPKLLFYVQHLLGMGHLQRAARFCQAAVDAGFEVFVLAGGERIAEIGFGPVEYIQLPAIRAADEHFSQLIDSQGKPVDEAFKAHRARCLQQQVERIQPDVLLLELYPFGRRFFRFELTPVLDYYQRCSTPPLVVSSVRDVLVENENIQRNQWIIEQLQCYFYKVLVHGDPNVIRLEETFPAASEIASMLAYTGYIVPPAGQVDTTPLNHDILVSAGSGVVGFDLLKLTQQACHLLNADSAMANLRWRMVAGPNMAQEQYQNLVEHCPANMIVERVRSDLYNCMAQAKLSISQAGYNTLLESLQAGPRLIWVPFFTPRETEQRFRAERLAQTSHAICLELAELNPEIMADNIRQSLAGPAPAATALQLDGARQSAQQLLTWLAER